MKNLEHYMNQKEKLLANYNQIIGADFLLPLEDITVDVIETRKHQLEKEHFFASVTGQIKSGKSTLLNALLFGDEILPSDDTPHTAKITRIQ